MARINRCVFTTFLVACFCLTFTFWRLDIGWEYIKLPTLYRSIQNYTLREHAYRDGKYSQTKDSRVKKIMLWSPWLREHHRPLINCPYDCVVSNKTEDQPDSDVLLFHFKDFRHKETEALPDIHPRAQNWVLVSNESPNRIFLKKTVSDNLFLHRDKFNSIMMYTRESDIFRPYGSYSKINKTRENMHFLASKKTKLILWYVSDCDPKRRAEIGGFLKRRLPSVDIFGDCVKNEDPCKHDLDCVKTFSAKYKFYLAFENANCHDYITEKFWKALMFGMVPIVFGAEIEDYQALAPPNSFIHVLNFTTLEKLARYIQYLDNKPEAYNAYHAWRADYVIDDVRGWWWKGHEIDYYSGEKGMWCTVCKAAHNTSFVPRKLDLIDYFESRKTCTSARLSKIRNPGLWQV